MSASSAFVLLPAVDGLALQGEGSFEEAITDFLDEHTPDMLVFDLHRPAPDEFRLSQAAFAEEEQPLDTHAVALPLSLSHLLFHFVIRLASLLPLT